MHDSPMRIAAKVFLNIQTPSSSYGPVTPHSYFIMKFRQFLLAAAALVVATLFSSCAVDGYGYQPGYYSGGRYYASQAGYGADYYPDYYAGYYPDDYYYGASYYNPYPTGLLLTGGYWNSGHHHHYGHSGRRHYGLHSGSHRGVHSGTHYGLHSGTHYSRREGLHSGTHRGVHSGTHYGTHRGTHYGTHRGSDFSTRSSGGWSGGTRSGGGYSATPAPSRAVAPQRNHSSGGLPAFKGAVSRGGSGGYNLRSSGSSSGQKSGRLGRD